MLRPFDRHHTGEVQEPPLFIVECAAGFLLNINRGQNPRLIFVYPARAKKPRIQFFLTFLTPAGQVLSILIFEYNKVTLTWRVTNA